MTATFDEIAPNYLRARERWPEAPTLGNHYEAIITSYNGSCHGLVDTVKSFIECVCLTILGEFGKSMPSSNPSTTELFVETLRVLGLENTRGVSKFDRVLSAHNRLADALSEMRNENGPISHGKDGFLDTLSSNHTRAFLVTGDTILCLLLSALEGKDPDVQFTREPYEKFVRLHERIDSSVTVESSVADEDGLPILLFSVRTPSLSDGIELRVEPSRLLYSIDRTAYVELLAASVTRQIPPEEVAEELPTEKPVPVTEEVASTTEFVPLYEGVLSPLRNDLQQYLASLSVTPTAKGTPGIQLVDSLLATAESSMGIDWAVREALQARMKVALLRVFVQFGLSREDAISYAEHLVSWFKMQPSATIADETKASSAH